MPWCPKCKNEYREGIEVCADCGTKLIDELPKEIDYELVFSTEKEELADRLSAYLTYSKIDNVKKELPEEKVFNVYVAPESLKKAKGACAAFAVVESERLAKEKAAAEKDAPTREELQSEFGFETEEEYEAKEHAEPDDDLYGYEDDDTLEFTEDDESIDETEESERSADTAKKMLYSQNSVYVKKSEQSKELKSTALTFYAFGVLLLVFTILNVTEVITLFSGPISLGVLALLTVAFIGVGINSSQRAKKAAADALEEDKLTETINKWMNENVTESVVKSFDRDDLTAEVNYMERFDGIKKMLTDVFGEIDDAYLDSLIEEFYNANFDKE